MTGPGERPKHVLLVDDDPLVVKVYAERMRYEGWIVAVARDGWEACQEAGRSRFDIILLDIRMPFHNGVEVLKEIRTGNVNRETPVYVLTGLTEGDAVDDALRLGADGVFYKSSTRPDELVKKVAAILEAVPAPSLVDPEVPDGTMEQVVLRETGAGGVPSAVPDEFFAAGAPAEKSEVAVEEQVKPSDLDRDFDLYVNPFLGSGGLLSKALGLKETYQCGECGGQVCLRITRDPRLAGKAVVGSFLCSRCGAAV